jgi:hypothetical protein
VLATNSDRTQLYRPQHSTSRRPRVRVHVAKGGPGPRTVINCRYRAVRFTPVRRKSVGFQSPMQMAGREAEAQRGESLPPPRCASFSIPGRRPSPDRPEKKNVQVPLKAWNRPFTIRSCQDRLTSVQFMHGCVVIRPEKAQSFANRRVRDGFSAVGVSCSWKEQHPCLHRLR